MNKFKCRKVGLPLNEVTLGEISRGIGKTRFASVFKCSDDTTFNFFTDGIVQNRMDKWEFGCKDGTIQNFYQVLSKELNEEYSPGDIKLLSNYELTRRRVEMELRESELALKRAEKAQEKLREIILKIQKRSKKDKENPSQ